MESGSSETVRVRKVVRAKKERVFRAWTDPEEMKRWWSLGEGWKTSFVEMDPRVGGRFALGNQPADGSAILITGEFLEIKPPDKLVYRWLFHTPTPEESLVTVEFHDLGSSTEVVITHVGMSKDMGPSAIAGWSTALSGLASLLD
jgi:uncharacterized protein YndB with AHSA1/START domain